MTFVGVRSIRSPVVSDARYYFTESLWPDLTSSNSVEACERLAARLLEEFGVAFARVVRDDRGQVLTPSWLDVIAMTGDPRGGPVAVAAWFRMRLWAFHTPSISRPGT